MTFYAGIGSRKTPNEICKIMEDLAEVLAQKGYILRSGGADGADLAFENGCKRANGKMEIYLPWKGFNKNSSKLYTVSQAARDYTSKFHPGWIHLETPVQNMMGRNAYQVLGEDLKTPGGFVVCWTPDGCISPQTRKKTTGGTGQAISIAFENKIPVYNLSIPEHLNKIKQLIEKHNGLPHINKTIVKM